MITMEIAILNRVDRRRYNEQLGWEKGIQSGEGKRPDPKTDRNRIGTESGKIVFMVFDLGRVPTGGARSFFRQ